VLPAVSRLRRQPAALRDQVASVGGGQPLVDVAVEDHGASLIVDACTMAPSSHKIK
jgi:hypothetical protein